MGEAFGQGRACCAMELHPRSVAFKVLWGVAATVIWNHPRLLKLRGKRSILDLLCERRLHLLKLRRFSSHLDNIKLLLELLYFCLHLVQGFGVFIMNMLTLRM